MLLATCLLSFVQAITTTTIGFPHKIQSSCYYSAAFLPDCLLAQFCTSNNRDSLQKSKPSGACLLDQICTSDKNRYSFQRSKPTADAATGCLLRLFKQQQFSSGETALRVHLITKAIAANLIKSSSIILHHQSNRTLQKTKNRQKTAVATFQRGFLVKKKNHGISKGEEEEEFPHNPTSTRPKQQLLVHSSKEKISKTLVLQQGFWQGKERSN